MVTTLFEHGHSIFRLDDVRNILGLSAVSARSFARKLIDRGVASRIKSGLFVLVPYEMGRESQYLGNPYVAAREIVRGEDYYLSHGTAMEIHGMVTQPQLIVTITTLKTRRPVAAQGARFRFVHCRQRNFFGLTDIWATKQEKVRVSDPERTIIDGLNRPGYCGGLTEVAKALWIKRQDLDTLKLVDYAERLGVGAVLRRLGYLLETYELGTPEILERLRGRLTSTSARLDPILPAGGRRLGRWRLQLNVPVEELMAVAHT